jgi:hypothetical protein
MQHGGARSTEMFIHKHVLSIQKIYCQAAGAGHVHANGFYTENGGVPATSTLKPGKCSNIWGVRS